MEAAAVPEVWLTAYQLLYFVGNFQSGETVLVHAAGSGVRAPTAPGTTPHLLYGAERVCV
jgi:hypothetical protein